MDDQATDVGSTPVPGAPVEGGCYEKTSCVRCWPGWPAGSTSRRSRASWASTRRRSSGGGSEGGWRPQRRRGCTRKRSTRYRPFLERRGPEVGWNGMVLLRELQSQGFTGGYQQVQRAAAAAADDAAVGGAGDGAL